MITLTKSTTLITVSTILFLLNVTTQAQFYPPSPSPEMVPGPDMGPTAPENDCLTKLANMSDCLSYVEEGSNATVPDKNCCPELAGLVESEPICLCQLLGNTSQLGINIELNKALKLPSICKVSTPSVSLCAVAGYPVAAPSSEPSSAPTGGEAASSPSGDKGASVITSSPQPLLLGLAFALLVVVLF